jgi:adenylate kinase
VLDGAGARNNQSLLVAAFEAYSRETQVPVLLDGHFVVPTEAGPEPVGVDVFKELRLDALVVVRAEPDVIADRLRARQDRSRWWDGTTKGIESLQELEVAAASSISRALDLPLTLLTGTPNERTLVEVFLRALMA